MTSDSLIVLRFRDIEVELGETIRQHRLVINEHGYVWWGWLFRDYELSPAGQLQQLTADEVALYDTGQGRVYRAHCQDIVVDPRPRRSPSLDHTPPYYRTRSAPAWFKFDDIEPASEDWIVGRSCLAMPSASDECYTDLEGEVVGQLRELRRQEVTLWILGPRS